MAQVFDINVRLMARGPYNVDQVVRSLRDRLGNTTFDVDARLSPGAARGVNSLASDARKAASGLDAVSRNATAASRSLKGVSVGPRASGEFASLNRQMGTAARTAGTVASSLGSARSAAYEFGQQLGVVSRRVGAFFVVIKAIDAVRTAFRDGVGQAVAFQHEMVRLSQVGGVSSHAIAGISREIGRLAVSVGTSSQQLSGVATTLKQAGLSAEDTRVALAALAKTTVAPTFDSLTGTVEGSIAAMQQFKLQAKDLESALGSVNTVSAAFAVESDDLVTAIRKTGGAFRAASGDLVSSRESFNQLLALFTSVRQTTRESADEIATGLRTIFSRLQDNNVSAALKDLNVDLHYTADEAKLLGQNVTGQFVGAYEAIRRISSATRNLSTTDPRFAQIASQIGGYRQISRVVPLLQQFSTAQHAYQIAQAGSNSLTRDAAKAQESFAVRLTQVKEEFYSLLRGFGEDKNMKGFLELTLNLASGATKLAKALEPLLPLLAAFAISKGVQSSFAIGRGFKETFANIPSAVQAIAVRAPKIPVKKADGGVVPGTGHGDTVPASLQAGSFVIRRPSAEKIGYGRLAAMAGYNDGGKVDCLLTPKEYVFTPQQARRIGLAKLRAMNETGRAPEIRDDPTYQLAMRIKGAGGMEAMYADRKASGGVVHPAIKRYLQERGLGFLGEYGDRLLHSFTIHGDGNYTGKFGRRSNGAYSPLVPGRGASIHLRGGKLEDVGIFAAHELAHLVDNYAAYLDLKGQDSDDDASLFFASTNRKHPLRKVALGGLKSFKDSGRMLDYPNYAQPYESLAFAVGDYAAFMGQGRRPTRGEIDKLSAVHEHFVPYARHLLANFPGYASGGMVETPHGRVRTTKFGSIYNYDNLKLGFNGQKYRRRRSEADPETGELTAKALFYQRHRQARYAHRLGFADGGEVDPRLRVAGVVAAIRATGGLKGQTTNILSRIGLEDKYNVAVRNLSPADLATLTQFAGQYGVNLASASSRPVGGAGVLRKAADLKALATQPSNSVLGQAYEDIKGAGISGLDSVRDFYLGIRRPSQDSGTPESYQEGIIDTHVLSGLAAKHGIAGGEGGGSTTSQLVRKLGLRGVQQIYDTHPHLATQKSEYAKSIKLAIQQRRKELESDLPPKPRLVAQSGEKAANPLVNVDRISDVGRDEHDRAIAAIDDLIDAGHSAIKTYSDVSGSDLEREIIGRQVATPVKLGVGLGKRLGRGVASQPVDIKAKPTVLDPIGPRHGRASAPNGGIFTQSPALPDAGFNFSSPDVGIGTAYPAAQPPAPNTGGGGRRGRPRKTASGSGEGGSPPPPPPGVPGGPPRPPDDLSRLLAAILAQLKVLDRSVKSTATVSTAKKKSAPSTPIGSATTPVEELEGRLNNARGNGRVLGPPGADALSLKRNLDVRAAEEAAARKERELAEIGDQQVNQAALARQARDIDVYRRRRARGIPAPGTFSDEETDRLAPSSPGLDEALYARRSPRSYLSDLDRPAYLKSERPDPLREMESRVAESRGRGRRVFDIGTGPNYGDFRAKRRAAEEAQAERDARPLFDIEDLRDISPDKEFAGPHPVHVGRNAAARLGVAARSRRGFAGDLYNQALGGITDADRNGRFRSSTRQLLERHLTGLHPTRSAGDISSLAERLVGRSEASGKLGGLFSVLARRESAVLPYSPDNVEDRQAFERQRLESLTDPNRFRDQLVRHFADRERTRYDASTSYGRRNLGALPFEERESALDVAAQSRRAEALADAAIVGNHRVSFDRRGNIRGVSRPGAIGRFLNAPIRLPRSFSGLGDSAIGRGLGSLRSGGAIGSRIESFTSGYRGFAALGAAAYAPYLLEQGFGTVRNPTGNRQDAANAQAIGGGFTGAAVGAQVGGLFGPIGIAVGAAAGGLTGFVKSLHNAKHEIDAIKFEDSFRKVEHTIAAVADGRLDLRSNLGGVGGAVDLARSEAGRRVAAEGGGGNVFDRYGIARGPLSFLSAGGERIHQDEAKLREAKFSEILAPQLPALQGIVQRVAAEAAKTVSLNDLTVGNKTQSQLDRSRSNRLAGFAALGGTKVAQTIADIDKVPVEKLLEEVDRVIVATGQQAAREKALATEAALATQSLAKFGRLGDSLDAAANSISGLRHASDTISALFEGRVSAGRVSGFEGPATRAGGIDAAGFRNSVSFVQNSLGGNAGGLFGEFAKTIGEVDEVRRTLGSRIADAVGKGGLGEDEIAGNVRGAIGGYSSGIQSRLGAAIDTFDPKELQQRVAQDPDKLAGELIDKVFGDLEGTFEGLKSQLQSHFNERADRFAAGISLRGQHGDTLDRASSARLGATVAAANVRALGTGLTGEDSLTLQQLRQPIVDRQNRLAGPNAFNPEAIGRRLAAIPGEIERQHAVIQNPGAGGGERANAQQAESLLTSEAANLRKALEDLADTSRETAAVQAKLNQVERQRAGQINLTERLLTAGPQELRQLQKGSFLSSVAVRQGNFRGFNARQISETLEHLRGLGDLTVGGRTGNAHAERLLENSGAIARTFDPRLNAARKGLLQNQQGVEERGAKALGEIAKNQGGLFDRFIANLKEQNSDFLSRMDQLIGQAGVKDKEGAANRAKAAQGGIADQFNKARGLGGRFALAGQTEEQGLANARRIANAPQLGELRESLLAIDKIQGGRRLTLDGLGISGTTKAGFDDKFIEKHRGELEARADIIGGRTGLTADQFRQVALPKYLDRLDQFRQGKILRGRGFSVSNELNSAINQAKPEIQGVLNARKNDALAGLSEAAFGNRPRTGDIDATLIGAARNADKLQSDVKGVGIGTLAEGQAKLEAAEKNLAKAMADLAAAIKKAGGQPAEAHALGGPIFRPRGTDIVPAMLTPGEFVVNAPAARRNRGLLERMNRDKKPVYRADGGPIDADAIRDHLVNATRYLDEAQKSGDRAGIAKWSESIRVFERELGTAADAKAVTPPAPISRLTASDKVVHRTESGKIDTAKYSALHAEDQQRRQAAALKVIAEAKAKEAPRRLDAQFDAFKKTLGQRRIPVARQQHATGLGRGTRAYLDYFGDAIDSYKAYGDDASFDDRTLGLAAKNRSQLLSRIAFHSRPGGSSDALNAHQELLRRFDESNIGKNLASTNASRAAAGQVPFGLEDDSFARSSARGITRRKLLADRSARRGRLAQSRLLRRQLASGYAGGGMIPAGADRVPAMLSEGEMVMSPRAARDNAATLREMNRRPIYRADGGPVGHVPSGGGGGGPGRGSAIEPASLSALQQFARGLAEATGKFAGLAQSLDKFGQSAASLSEGFASARSLAESMKPFADAALQLSKSLANVTIPSAIQVQTKSQVEVLLNGGGLLSALKGDLAKEVVGQVMERLPAIITKQISEMPAR